MGPSSFLLVDWHFSSSLFRFQFFLHRSGVFLGPSSCLLLIGFLVLLYSVFSSFFIVLENVVLGLSFEYVWSGDCFDVVWEFIP